MIGKIFLGNEEKKGNHSLWLVGALAMALCAFLASGMVGDEEPALSESETVATKTDAENSALADAQNVDADQGGAAKKSWRTTKRKARVPRGPGVGSVWKTIGALILVLTLVFVGATFFTRVLKKVRMRPQGAKVLELVDVIPLGPKKQIFVVSAYGRRLVVGATNDSMNVLSEFGPDEIEAVETDQPLDFADKLTNRLNPRSRNTMATLEVEA